MIFCGEHMWEDSLLLYSYPCITLDAHLQLLADTGYYSFSMVYLLLKFCILYWEGLPRKFLINCALCTDCVLTPSRWLSDIPFSILVNFPIAF